MRDFALVFKTLYRNFNVRKYSADGKRKASPKVLIFIILAVMAAVFCVMVGYFTVVGVKSVEALSIVITAIVATAQLLALLLNVYSAIQTLYSSSDRALLSSLPLRPAAVFMAKFALSYVELLKTCAIVILPLTLTTSIAYAACGREMFYAFFVLIFAVTAISPLLPLALIALFSLPINYIASFLKGHNVLKSVLLILVYAAAFAGYMALVLIGNGAVANAPDHVDGAMSSALNGLKMFGTAMYPTKVAVQCALGINGGVNFGISVAICVGLLAICLLLSALFYKRIMQRSMEANDDKSRSKGMSFKQNRLVGALIKKDFLDIIRNPQMALSCFGNSILCPVLVAILGLSFTGGFSEEAERQILSIIMLSVSFSITTMYIGAGNMLSVLAFSREGKAYFVNKSLPIAPQKQVVAKVTLAAAVSAVINVLNVVVLLALFRTSFVNALLFYVCSEMCILGAIGLNVYTDARHGNANWSTRQEMQQISGGLSRLGPALLCGIAPIVTLTSGAILAGVGGAVGLKQTLIYAIFWAICMASSAIFMAIGLALALRFAAKYLDSFGERIFVSRKGRKGGASGEYKAPRNLMK